jgi:hypothetical protein
MTSAQQTIETRPPGSESSLRLMIAGLFSKNIGGAILTPRAQGI